MVTDYVSQLTLDSGTAIWAVLGVVVIAIALFMLLKGVIKMLLLASVLCAAVGLWIFLQRNGCTYLEFVMDSPPAELAELLPWLGSGFVLLVSFHIRTWFMQLFSADRRAGAGCIITTLMMCALMLWLGLVGLSYYCDISRIGYYHELALSQINPPAQQAPGQPAVLPKPWLVNMKSEINRQSALRWLLSLSPMENPAQTNLACLLAYGCTFDEATATAFYQQSLAGIGLPQPSRVLDLLRDPGLRRLVSDRRFVTLLENERLTTVVQFRDTEEKLISILEN